MPGLVAALHAVVPIRPQQPPPANAVDLRQRFEHGPVVRLGRSPFAGLTPTQIPTSSKEAAVMMRLCPACTQARSQWQAVRYNPRRPAEWPGGQHILDGRTSHQQRRRDWETKTAAQVALIEDICARQHLTQRLLQLDAA